MLRLTFLTVFALLFTAALPAHAANKKLRVYILAGQSNMQGHAHVRTIETMKLNPRSAKLYNDIRNADGSDKVHPRVRVSAIGSSESEKLGPLSTGFGPESRGPKFGPELTFGTTIAKSYDGPILIIKTAWGGKSINTDFRSPSAGAYEFNEKQLENYKKQNKDIAKIKAAKAEATGHYYRLMVEHVGKVLADPKRAHPDYDPAAGYELAGFVWFQGWNDMVDSGFYPDRYKPGGYDKYTGLMAHFIRDVRKEFDAPKLPFVIGVIGVGGATNLYGPKQQRYKGVHQYIRDAMAAPAKMPEFKGNVAAVLTEKFWDHDLMKLRERAAKFKPQVDAIRAERKAGKITREQETAAIDKLYAAEFSARELEHLNNSTSNAEYHYLGSAIVMSQIGNAFAEAMLEIQSK